MAYDILDHKDLSKLVWKQINQAVQEQRIGVPSGGVVHIEGEDYPDYLIKVATLCHRIDETERRHKKKKLVSKSDDYLVPETKR